MNRFDTGSLISVSPNVHLSTLKEIQPELVHAKSMITYDKGPLNALLAYEAFSEVKYLARFYFS